MQHFLSPTVQHTHTWGNAEEQLNGFKSFQNVNKKQHAENGRVWATAVEKPSQSTESGPERRQSVRKHALRRPRQTPALVWVLLLVLHYRESHSLLYQRRRASALRDKIQIKDENKAFWLLKQHREYAFETLNLKSSPKPSKTSSNKAHGPNSFHLPNDKTAKKMFA